MNVGLVLIGILSAGIALYYKQKARQPQLQLPQPVLVVAVVRSLIKTETK